MLQWAAGRKSADKTIYYRHVVEATTVRSTGLVFSLMTKFTENPEGSDPQGTPYCSTGHGWFLFRRPLLL